MAPPWSPRVSQESGTRASLGDTGERDAPAGLAATRSPGCGRGAWRGGRRGRPIVAINENKECHRQLWVGGGGAKEVGRTTIRRRARTLTISMCEKVGMNLYNEWVWGDKGSNVRARVINCGSHSRGQGSHAFRDDGPSGDVAGDAEAVAPDLPLGPVVLHHQVMPSWGEGGGSGWSLSGVNRL